MTELKRHWQSYPSTVLQYTASGSGMAFPLIRSVDAGSNHLWIDAESEQLLHHAGQAYMGILYRIQRNCLKAQRAGTTDRLIGQTPPHGGW